MKKLFLMALVAVCSMSANAQFLRSVTQAAKKSNTTWYLRAGISLNNATGDYVSKVNEDVDFSSKVGYDFELGFNKPMGNFGMYWGMNLGFSTRGFSAEYNEEGVYEKNNLLTHAFKFSPFTFGYKYSVTDDLKLDAHLGGYISVDMAGTYKKEWNYDFGYDEDSGEADIKIGDLDDYNRFDAGIQAGIGVWFKRFNLDFFYQRGFISALDKDTYGGDCYSSNFNIRLGVAF